MKRTILFGLLLVVLGARNLSAVTPDPNPGGVVDVLTYFPMTGAGCMNPTATLGGGAARVVQASATQQCSGVGTMYFLFKGAPRWSTESYFVDGGWLKIYEEALYQSNGVDYVRVFRDHWTGRKGLKWMPASWSTSAPPSWNDDPTDIDFYDNNGPCYGVPLSSHGPADIGYGQAYTVTFSNWLRDGRTTRTNPPAFTNGQTVYAVVKSGTYFSGDGTKNTENYYYGKFYSTADSKWYGLGLIKFEAFVNDVLTSSTELKYLLNCSVSSICNSCPDP